MRGARPRRKWGGPMMRPPQTSTNLSGGAASLWPSPHTSVSGAVERASAGPRSETVRLPAVVAQEPVELVGPFFREEDRAPSSSTGGFAPGIVSASQ